MLDERLKTFLAVVETGSFSAAARQRFITQPAVTQQIRILEGRYRVPLFVRHERGARLTPAGLVLFQHAVKMAEMEALTNEAMASHHESLQGQLRIAATLTLGEYVVPPIVGRFKTAHPEVEILLEVENTPRVVEHVAAGHYSVGLIEGPFHNALVQAEKLIDDELSIVCGASHPLAERGRLSLDDLTHTAWVLREPESGTRHVFEDALIKAGVDPLSLKVAFQIGSTQAVKGLVRGGAGLTALSPWTVREELAAGVLRELAVPELDLHRPFNFVVIRGGRLPLVTRHFMDFCRDQISLFGTPAAEGTSPGAADTADSAA